MTADEKRHLDRVQGLGCVVCRNEYAATTPAEIHHIRTGYGIGERAPHYQTLPLCPDHHRTGGRGIAFHAGPRTWECRFGTELELLEQTRQELMLETTP